MGFIYQLVVSYFLDPTYCTATLVCFDRLVKWDYRVSKKLNSKIKKLYAKIRGLPTFAETPIKCLEEPATPKSLR